jgi:hypothetical protein
MTEIASLPMILGAAALLAALPALAAAFLAWRAAVRQAALGHELGARLRDLRERLDGARSQRGDTAASADLAALRDDLAILFEHVSALTTGQLDVKKIVGSTVARHVAAVTDRLEQTESRADERAARLHDRVALVQERLADLADDIAALKAVAPISARAPLPDAAPEMPAAEAIAPQASVADAPVGDAAAKTLVDWHANGAGPDPANGAPSWNGAAAPLPPRRAPPVFDSGRVAMLMPVRRSGTG